jgi:nitroreductase
MTRRFSSEPLDHDAVTELCDLARRAPSAGFAQGARFLVLADADRDLFWDASGARAWFAERAPGVIEAPVLVLPLADSRAYLARYGEGDKVGHGLDQADAWPVPHWLTDTAFATQQLLLLAEDRGWGALYAGIFRHLDRVRAAFGLPGEVTPIGFVALGHRHHDDRPSGSPRRRRRLSTEEVVLWGRWRETVDDPDDDR